MGLLVIREELLGDLAGNRVEDLVVEVELEEADTEVLAEDLQSSLTLKRRMSCYKKWHHIWLMKGIIMK